MSKKTKPAKKAAAPAERVRKKRSFEFYEDTLADLRDHLKAQPRHKRATAQELVETFVENYVSRYVHQK